MRRRRYLALAGATLAGLAGCTGPAADPGSEPGSSPGGSPNGSPTDSPPPTTDPPGTGSPTSGVETYGYDGAAALDRLDGDLPQRAVGPYYLAVAARPAHAERLAGELDDAGARAFLRGTAYERASVVCLGDAAGSSHPDLAVDSVGTADGVATVAVRYPGRGGTGDIARELLLVRVPDPDVAHATVALTDQGGTTTRFSTVGRHGRARLADPRPVVVRNRDCSPVDLGVSATVDGELVYVAPRTERYPAGTVVRHERALGGAGDHRVVVDSGAGTAATTVSLRAGAADPTGVLVDVAGDGRVSVSGRGVAELPTAGSGSCETDRLPYESPDPSENLDDPVGLTWRNRGDRAVSLGLTVRDGEPVVDRTVALPAGGKGRTEPLVARRGTYETRLAPAPGEARTVRWRVDEPGDDLGVLVEADGSLSVATGSLA